MKEIIVIHGWAEDSKIWEGWKSHFTNDKWLWQHYERGYGDIPSVCPSWLQLKEGIPNQKRTLICHSFGFHLINKSVLKKATEIVLISSFSNFISNGKESRSQKIALTGMKKAIGTSEEDAMLKTFLIKITHPYPINSLPSTPITNGISSIGRKKLIEDLTSLTKTHGLPQELPIEAKVLVVFGEQDLIIPQSVKESLLTELTKYLNRKPTFWSIPEEGHSMFNCEIGKKVKDWIDQS